MPLGAELTSPVDGCRGLGLLALLEDDEGVGDAGVALETELVELAAVAEPGIVAAPIAANTPTAARAPAPTQNVRRLRSRIAASRASMRVVSMGVSLSNVTGMEMGTT